MLPDELDLAKGKKGAPQILKLLLHHGDQVIMSGKELQAYFLHSVEPKGKLRFALTCRGILENHLKPEELPAYGVEPDEIKYDGFKLPNPE